MNEPILPLCFNFDSYKISDTKDVTEVLFCYSIHFKKKKTLSFTEKIVFSKEITMQKTIPPQLLQAIHLMLGISYYKLYCPSKIEHPYKLNKKQADFWQTIYKNGLGEFFYRNKIDPKDLCNFSYTNNYKIIPTELQLQNRSLVGIGGGKDSIVVAELMKEFNKNFSPFKVETQQKSPIKNAVIKQIDKPAVTVQRFLDPQIFESHEQSYNGHIPISAVIAFLSILTATLYSYKYIIVGNEFSSNFGNLEYAGLTINHQWSKSEEFELLFQDYIHTFITPSINYFSLLRPFHEIRIAQMFAKYEDYFNIFSSCNRNFKAYKDRGQHLWCGECPKCVFVFTILAPFIQKEKLLKLFGKNLFTKKDLLPLFKDLLGLGKLKPFDCVGTFQETQAAFLMAQESYSQDFIIKSLSDQIVQNESNNPKSLFKAHNSPNIPPEFKFLGLESALILGYGKEGKVTETFLQKFYPKIKVGIADSKNDSQYLNQQESYDITIKTPGIPKQKVYTHYTTATNIFFSQIQNKIIGITGTKGKSTTSSLIYSILKEAGLDVALIGNIGSPMLNVLTKDIPKNRIFIIELSSYQLDDIKYSPDISVILNLFPEHMDYHGNIDNYFNAKKNIIKYQKSSNTFIFNKQSPILNHWTEHTNAVSKSFNDVDITNIESNLIGDHNIQNIQAAILTVKELGITDNIIKKAIAKFKPLSHRLENIGTYKDITFYDDAISTTPESTVMAIRSIPNISTIFLGGTDRGYDFSILEEAIKEYKITNIVLFPESGNRILKNKKGLNIFETSSMKEAVEFAYKYTKKNHICLLSTASPSYSLWTNFEQKGSEFKKYVTL